MLAGLLSHKPRDQRFSASGWPFELSPFMRVKVKPPNAFAPAHHARPKQQLKTEHLRRIEFCEVNIFATKTALKEMYAPAPSAASFPSWGSATMPFWQRFAYQCARSASLAGRILCRVPLFSKPPPAASALDRLIRHCDDERKVALVLVDVLNVLADTPFETFPNIDVRSRPFNFVLLYLV
jgi:hypothetical protein